VSLIFDCNRAVLTLLALIGDKGLRDRRGLSIVNGLREGAESACLEALSGDDLFDAEAGGKDMAS